MRLIVDNESTQTADEVCTHNHSVKGGLGTWPTWYGHAEYRHELLVVIVTRQHAANVDCAQLSRHKCVHRTAIRLGRLADAVDG